MQPSAPPALELELLPDQVPFFNFQFNKLPEVNGLPCVKVSRSSEDRLGFMLRIPQYTQRCHFHCSFEIKLSFARNRIAHVDLVKQTAGAGGGATQHDQKFDWLASDEVVSVGCSNVSLESALLQVSRDLERTLVSQELLEELMGRTDALVKTTRPLITLCGRLTALPPYAARKIKVEKQFVLYSCEDRLLAEIQMQPVGYTTSLVAKSRAADIAVGNFLFLQPRLASSKDNSSTFNVFRSALSHCGDYLQHWDDGHFFVSDEQAVRRVLRGAELSSTSWNTHGVGAFLAYARGSGEAVGMIGIVGYKKGEYDLYPDQNIITASIIIDSHHTETGNAVEALTLALSSVLRISKERPPFGGEPWRFLVTSSLGCARGQSLASHFGMVVDRVHTFHYRWGYPDIDKMLWMHPIQTQGLDATACADALLKYLYDKEFDPLTRRIVLHDTHVPRKRLKADHESTHSSADDWTSQIDESEEDLLFTAFEIIKNL